MVSTEITIEINEQNGGCLLEIRQKEDGSGEILFSEEEIKIITKEKKLVLTTIFLKHFINLFMSVFFEYQRKFDEKTKNITTPLNTIIETSKPKKDGEV
jgi:hypothetical protein